MAYLQEHLHDAIHYEMTKKQMETSVMENVSSGLCHYKEGEEKYVVSLTTHGRRIFTVFQAIESIFLQTVKAHHVVLYLSKDEFLGKELPKTLMRQQKRGLEIRYVKDIKAYTKLIPALQDFPNDTIITIDDDYMYPFDMIDRLTQCHHRNPDAVCCCHSRMLNISKGKDKLYSASTIYYPEEDTKSNILLAEGFGGVLYPHHSLHEDVFEEKLFSRLSPYADDLWYKAMELKQGTPVVQIARNSSWIHSLCSEQSVQDEGLVNINIGQNKNDSQFKALFDHFDLYSNLI